MLNEASYREALAQQEATGSLRECRTFAPTQGMEGHLNGQPVVNFCSNDYLGLSQDPRLHEVAMQAIRQYGVGSGAARLVSGSHPLFFQLETALAQFKSTEAALVFNSGYQANVGILQALLQPGDWVFCDQHNHASLVDGCLLSGARWARYRHLDLNHLEKRLQAAQSKRAAKSRQWIVTDSVFSMDGDYPDLKVLAELAERYGAFILLDEAHATGLYGETRSSGLAEHFGVSDRITLQMGTFSKALGGFGAYVAGSHILIQTLVNRARSFIYSTALPPAVIAANLKAIEVVQQDASLKQQLWHNIGLLQAGLGNIGLPASGRSPIFPILIGKNVETLNASQRLLQLGCFVQGIRPPTVPVGTARLRLTVSAQHSATQIQKLLTALVGLKQAFEPEADRSEWPDQKVELG